MQGSEEKCFILQCEQGAGNSSESGVQRVPTPAHGGKQPGTARSSARGSGGVLPMRSQS